MGLRPLAATASLIGLTSAALLAYGGYGAWDAARVPPLRVETPDLALGNATAGTITAVEYVVVNDSSEPVRLLGGDAHCFANCCFGPKLTDLPTIPPGGRVSVPYEVSVRTPGETFAAESNLFLYWRDRLVPLHVTVSGMGVAAAAH